MREPAVERLLDPLEVASGIVFGTVDTCPELPIHRVDDSPLAALERACLPALMQPPCLVSFSGGLDSSLVLAAAVQLARREGLPLPVPATNRFRGAPATHESEWQELVVRSLGLHEWIVLDHTHELDAVGPVATTALRRHGLLWPFNAFFHVPLLEAARGGTLLTGIGGDELFGVPRWARAFDVLRGRARPSRRDLRRVALLAAPRPLRRAVLSRRLPPQFPWVRPLAYRELAQLWAADEAEEPVRLRARVRRIQAGRPLRVGLESLRLLAFDAGATIAHPLAAPEFGLAVAAAAPSRGYDSRSAAVLALFGDLLPHTLVERSTKALFDTAFWGRHSRALAASWNGEGVDPAVVDTSALRAVWAQNEPDAHTFLMLQAAWLEHHRQFQNRTTRQTASGGVPKTAVRF